MGNVKAHKSVSYAKWGYVFILPFLIVYIIFSLIPLLSTFYYSFFDYYRAGRKVIGPDFVGFKNYAELFSKDATGHIGFLRYFGNTMIMWVLGAVPQLLFSLVLSVIYTSSRMKIKGQRFFKTVMYMPNIIMAAAYGMLFFSLFSIVGPINLWIKDMGGQTINFFGSTGWSRGIVAFINFIMWFGNTTILLMAGIMGIDPSIFEAAQIDGASGMQAFFKITLPLLMPIMLYVAVTSLIGGLQMFDVPQIVTSGNGAPNRTLMTLIMNLNSYFGTSKNYGMAGALSVIIFAITGILSFMVFKTMNNPDKDKKKKKKARG